MQSNSADEFPADLLVELDRSRPRGLRVQLERGLRQAIASGSLAPGTALPPSRVLAAELSVSRSLVVAAYEQLLAEGYLEARQGSGTRVRPQGGGNGKAGDGKAGDGKAGVRHGSGTASDRGTGGPAAAPAAQVLPPVPAAPDPLPRAAGHGGIWGSGLPDPALFPRAEWLSHYRDVLRDIPDSALGYPHPRGTRELRVALTAYLGRVRGVRATPDQVVVCGGFSQGLVLLCRVLGSRGMTRVAVEDPCFSFHRRLIRGAGLRTRPGPRR